MNLKSLVCLSSLVLSCCTHLKFPEIPEYKLSKSGPFILSESPELWKFYERSFSTQNKKDVEFLVKNISSEAKALYISKATIDINGERTPLPCQQEPKVEGDLKVASQGTVRIQCQLNIQPTPGNHLGQKDSIVKLEIPYEGGTNLVLERLYRIEEFQ